MTGTDLLAVGLARTRLRCGSSRISARRSRESRSIFSASAPVAPICTTNFTGPVASTMVFLSRMASVYPTIVTYISQEAWMAPPFGGAGQARRRRHSRTYVEEAQRSPRVGSLSDAYDSSACGQFVPT